VDRRQPSPETPVDTATDLVAIAAAAISISGAHDPPSTKMQRMNAPSLHHHPRKLPKKHDLLIPKKWKKKKKITGWIQATSVYNLVTKFVNKNAKNRTRESQILCTRARGRDGENAKRRETVAGVAGERPQAGGDTLST
jgi:hypothetical protein